jgi:hypothetical protein
MGLRARLKPTKDIVLLCTRTAPCRPSYINKGSLADSGAQDAIT